MRTEDLSGGKRYRSIQNISENSRDFCASGAFAGKKFRAWPPQTSSRGFPGLPQGFEAFME